MSQEDNFSGTAKFYYNLEHRTMTIQLEGFVTVLGPFDNEAEAAEAAHEFCVARSIPVPESAVRPRSVH